MKSITEEQYEREKKRLQRAYDIAMDIDRDFIHAEELSKEMLELDDKYYFDGIPTERTEYWEE